MKSKPSLKYLLAPTQKLGPIELGCPSVIAFLYGLELLNGRDLVIGSNERSWSVDVPFDHFGQKHPTGSGQSGQKSPNSGFSRLELVRATIVELLN